MWERPEPSPNLSKKAKLIPPRQAILELNSLAKVVYLRRENPFNFGDNPSPHPNPNIHSHEN